MTVSNELLVIGSLNTDLAMSVEAFPAPGETIAASNSRQGPGGKGLNQAIAAARAGARTAMWGAVGDDRRGRDLLDVLIANGVEMRGVQVLTGRETGLAVIMLRTDGENVIVINQAANAEMPPVAVDDASAAPVILASLEVPLEPVESAFLQARRAGRTTILNAAPAVRGGDRLFPLADFIIVNETELARYAGAPCGNEDQRAAAARSLLSRGGQTIIVTLGGAGVQVVDGDGAYFYPAIAAEVVDTTGAGDCFCGVFAADIARDLPLDAAVRRAIAAASLAVRTSGAADAMPLAENIDALLKYERDRSW